MTVYVDRPIHRYRDKLCCHVWADTIEELHAAAKAAGLTPSWFQQPPKAQWQHYDATTEKRAILVAQGAMETDRYGALEFLARQRGDTAKLERIAALRAMRRSAAGEAAADDAHQPLQKP